MGSAVLDVLTRRGAWAVVQALSTASEPVTVRGLARLARASPATVARIVQDLESVAAVEVVRPGRDARVRWRRTPVAAWLAGLQPPDIAQEVEAAFVAGYRGPGTPRRWTPPAAGGLPVRLVVLTADEEAALDAVGPALDAVAAAGWPAPQVAVHDPASLDPDDPVAAAMLQNNNDKPT